jgi:hypothetical protein
VVTNPSKYFKKGRVFRVLWPEPIAPLGPSRSDSLTVVSDSKFQSERMFTKVRWFIVVQPYPTHCLCIPISTYGNQGATKPGVNPTNHAALVLDGTDQQLMPGEVLTKSPLHLQLEDKSMKLAASSRINFSRLYTVEYNVKVATVGRISHKDLELLDQYFKEGVFKQPAIHDKDGSAEQKRTGTQDWVEVRDETDDQTLRFQHLTVNGQGKAPTRSSALLWLEPRGTVVYYTTSSKCLALTTNT